MQLEEKKWEEKRKHKRAYVRFSVEYRGKSLWQLVEARDISAGGMFIVTEKIEPPGTKIKVSFNFTKDNRGFVCAEGIVVWNKAKIEDDGKGNILPCGMGIKFTKIIPFAQKNFINDMIEKGKME